VSCQMSKFGMASNCHRHSSAKRIRSFCERGLHIAGPFDLLSMRNCNVLLSAIMPVYPPIASISRTICPFATPPMAGLQLIWAITPIFIVISRLEEPRFAAAAAASHPACPPPTTITLYFLNLYFDLFHVKEDFKLYSFT